MDLINERILLADAIDSQAPLRHMEKTATVASFRTWRVLQSTIAQDPAINSVRKRFYYSITAFYILRPLCPVFRRFRIPFGLFADLMAQRGIPLASSAIMAPSAQARRPHFRPRPAASSSPCSAFRRFRIPFGLFADLMAEREGFEPSVHCCTYDFQSYPFGLSGISPYKNYR